MAKRRDGGMRAKRLTGDIITYMILDTYVQWG